MDIILMAALVPPLILLVLVYRLDKIEREPLPLIIKLFILGGLSTFLAAIIENVLAYMLEGTMDPNSTLFRAINYFLVVGWTEEGRKHMALKRSSWKHPAFDYRFDAVVYSVTAALGFAAVENISYVINLGLTVAPYRALTAIPGHCIFGIYMGYYYGMAKHCERMGERVKQSRYQFLSIFMPMLLHGFYDFCATSRSSTMSLVFLGYIVLLDILSIRAIRRFSRNDRLV